uniref:Uncharacterized protein n=1 Tax=Arundo donax TaxID=35708 RepID=A0A0A9BE35_ARUDO
MNLDHMPLW